MSWKIQTARRARVNDIFDCSITTSLEPMLKWELSLHCRCFPKLRHLYLKTSHRRFMAQLRPIKNANVPQKYHKASFATTVLHRSGFSCSCSYSFIEEQCSVNFPKFIAFKWHCPLPRCYLMNGRLAHWIKLWSWLKRVIGYREKRLDEIWLCQNSWPAIDE